MSALRRIVRRAGLVAFGLALALVATELALQAGAAYVRWRGQPIAPQWMGRGVRVICVGDSNTYGLGLERPEAYPAQLQARWDAQPELPPVEFVNLGVPGTNSSKLRNRLGEILRRFEPDVVLIMIGVNDAWTVAVPAAEGSPTLGQWLWNSFRVVRLLYMIWRAALNARTDVSVEFVPPDRDAPPSGTLHVGDEAIDLGYTQGVEWVPDDWDQALRNDLAAMIDQARAVGVQPVLLTYPSEMNVYRGTNTVIRDTGHDMQTPVIDVAAALRAWCPKTGCPSLFQPDYHATVQGNAVVAAAVERGLRPLIAANGAR